MRIDGIQSSSTYQAAQKVQSGETPQTKSVEDADKNDGQTSNQIRRDEYIKSEKSEEEQNGLYKRAQDGGSEECTVDTGKVDREIEKLKEKKEQLLKQINSAAGDEEKVKELEMKLSSVESELNQKNNDTYRKQNAEVS